jgi:hypothetical protein
VEAPSHSRGECSLSGWHPISTAPFDRDLELAVIGTNGVRTIVFHCRRILGGWIKAQIKTTIASDTLA